MDSLNEYISKPLSMGRQSADELELLREKYPYFQALHILIAKCHKNQNTFGYNKNLKIASLYAGDRKILFDYINYEGEKIELAAQEESIAQAEELHEIVQIESIEADATVLLDEVIVDQQIIPLVEIHLPKKPPIFEVVDRSRNDKERERVAADNAPLAESNREEIKIESVVEDSTDKEFIEDLPISLQESIEMKEVVFTESDSANDHVHVELKMEDDETIANPKTEEIEIGDEPQLEIQENLIEDLELTTETDLPEISENAVSQENLELIDIEITPEELDFNSWLDNFTLETPPFLSTSQKVNSIENRNAAAKENDEAETLLNKYFNEYTERDETTDPLEIDEELEELVALDHPAVLAEIAYDIQAFVNVPQSNIENEALTSINAQLQIDDLLDRFINKDPKISRPKAEFYNPDNMARKSEELNSEVVSETLATLFYKQGHLHQSLGIYEKLILQNPYKKEIFATQINKIKQELINRL